MPPEGAPTRFLAVVEQPTGRVLACIDIGAHQVELYSVTASDRRDAFRQVVKARAGGLAGMPVADHAA